MPPRNLLVIALTMVISLACYSVASKNRYANLFAEAMEVIDHQSLREIPREKLFVSAMEGMMSSLDEHSMYISGPMFQIFDEDIRQEFGGVGMYVETDPATKRPVVLAPMPGTPAFEAGIRAGDQIMKIDGQDTAGTTRRDSIQLLRGPIGEPVVLDLERDGAKLTRTLKRASIPVASVHGDYRNADGTWNYVLENDPRIGYVRLTQFGERSAIEMAEALNQDNGKIEGLIIDLRNNSGGLLDVAIEICDMFLPADLAIVRTRGRHKKLLKEHFSTSRIDLDPTVPIVVLVNRNSASASEIVAGCLQDHDRAVLIGEQSWGKGTVQNVIPIELNRSALKLTTASYWRPSGKHIDRFDEIAQQTQKWGVQPNPGFEIELTEEDVFDNVRQRNIRDLEGLLSEEESKFVARIRSYEPPNEAEDESSESATGDGSTDKQSAPSHEATPEEATAADAPAETPQESSDMDEPFVDRPLQRAIEYLQTMAQKRAIAA